MLKELLGLGVNVNHVNFAKETPLFEAVRAADLTVMQLLMEHGAEVHRVNAKCDNLMRVALKNYCEQREMTMLQIKETIRFLVPLAYWLDDYRFYDCMIKDIYRSPHNMEITKLLLRHGFSLSYKWDWCSNLQDHVRVGYRSWYEFRHMTLDAMGCH